MLMAAGTVGISLRQNKSQLQYLAYENLLKIIKKDILWSWKMSI